MFQFKLVTYQAIDLYIEQSGNQNTVQADYLVNMLVAKYFCKILILSYN